jgi:hypothetical protein
MYTYIYIHTHEYTCVKSSTLSPEIEKDADQKPMRASGVLKR